MAKKVYDNTSIKSLKGPDKIRKRPGVMLGSDDVTGTEHTFFEILSNSIDEAKDGHGNVIKIILHKDHSITIQDLIGNWFFANYMLVVNMMKIIMNIV